MSPCPKDTGVHYALALMYLRKFQCLSLWSLSSCGMYINITSPRSCFVPLNSACRIDNRGLICLPLLFPGSTAKQQMNCVRCVLGDFVQF